MNKHAIAARSTRRTGLVIAGLVSTAALLAGCGAAVNGQRFNPAAGSNDSSQSPAAELTSAVAALGKAPTLTTSITLGTTADVLGPVLTSLGAHVTPTEVAALASGQVSLEVAAPKGKQVEDLSRNDESGAYAFSLSSNGTTYVSVRRVDKTLFLQVDAKDLFTLIGQADRYAMLSAQSAILPPFVKALLDGKWVSLPEATLTALRELRAGGLGETPDATPSPSELPNRLSGLATVLSHAVTVTRVSAGSTDELRLTANTRTVVKDLAGLAVSTPPSARKDRRLARLGRLAHVPTHTVVLTAEVVHGALSELSINLRQFGQPGKTPVPLVVTFTRSAATISKPADAVALNAAGLMGLSGLSGLSGLLGGQGSGLLGGLAGSTST